MSNPSKSQQQSYKKTSPADLATKQTNRNKNKGWPNSQQTRYQTKQEGSKYDTKLNKKTPANIIPTSKKENTIPNHTATESTPHLNHAKEPATTILNQVEKKASKQTSQHPHGHQPETPAATTPKPSKYSNF